MAGICQINLSELPHVPASLQDFALVTLPTIGGRRSIAPSDAFPVRWDLIEADLPAWDDASRLLTDVELDDIKEEYHDVIGRPVDGLKVGGWPSLVQGEIFWAPWQDHPAEPEFVFQVDSDEKDRARVGRRRGPSHRPGDRGPGGVGARMQSL